MFGLHDVCSVEAHTDEGGTLRDVIRKTKFCAPAGVIAGEPDQHFIMPAPFGSGNNTSSCVGSVDTMLLNTAALFAVSDSGQGEGRHMPSVSWIGEGADWNRHYYQVGEQVKDVFTNWFVKLATDSRMVPLHGEVLASYAVAGVREVSPRLAKTGI